ncbi:LTA synthase family protein [Flavobacterium gelatinilyticum]|uniref:LTA synthase family protein n=1 Tax=Flavobacterium gelatinilyticum TaxID=3003260 RepID=UPI00247FEB4C|nr:alkaline phosphatase family protein [Flavobacterium gelatinilyticum]
MDNYKRNVFLFLERFILIFFVYQLTRILFYYLNLDLFHQLDYRVFIGGFFFDLAAITYINILFAIAHIVPGNFKYTKIYQETLRIAFYVVNIIFIATNFIDIIYYRFTNRRSTYGMITAKGMEHEAFILIPSFLKEFWYIAILFLVICFLLWKLIPKAAKTVEIEKLTRRNYLEMTAIISVFILGAVVVIRGGVQEKPIRIVDGIKFGNLNNSALVLNTPFTILKTFSKKNDLEKAAFFNPKELNSIYCPVQSIRSNEAKIKKNVVIIILESFGNENINRGQTPFLDSLITKSHYFKNAFANGKVSIDAVPSVISSIPSLMNSPFITSSFSLNRTQSLPHMLKKENYHTSFFHGAFNGSQNFDQYCKSAEFDEYYGKDEYTGKEAFDGRWGIFDDEFMQFYASKLNSFRQPFFSTIFTISSHNPYIIPDKYKGKFPKGETVIQESIAYTDFALRNFFKTIQKEDWYKNTLFVITADHTSSSGNKAIDQTSLGKFRIPILFFDPSVPDFKGVDERIFQQVDIMPSVLDYLHINTDVVSFGKSYKSKQNFAVHYLQGTYYYINNDYYMAFANNEAIGFYNWKKDPLLKHNLMHTETKLVKESEKFLKAYIQSFNNRVLDNELSI